MRSFDLKCSDCRHRYTVESESTWLEQDKLCPKCGSDTVHQTMKSYFRNGPLMSEAAVRNAQTKCCSCRRPFDDEDGAGCGSEAPDEEES